MRMEINLHFILFQELQERPDSGWAVARIVVVRESKNPDLTLEEGTAGFHPLE
jgi:hypothetical protein